MELLGSLHDNVLDVTCSEFEVFIFRVLWDNEAKLVKPEGCDDLVEELCLCKVNLF